jgi:aspartyl-tRNA(Asn)/glutamyl-tRNA(Gln) amidotransferase subunit A
VPRDGCTPLSTTLDSIGPLANSIACCAVADAVMAGEAPSVPTAMPVAGMRLAVPQSFVLDGCATAVMDAFADVCKALSAAGARLTDAPFAEFNEYTAINAAGGFAPIEAWAWHQPLIARRGNDYDPRVRGRIERAADMGAVEYIALVAARADLIARVTTAAAPYDALIMPTVAITAPPIAAFEKDEDYRRLNALILRNTSLINFLDGCAATVPIQRPGAPPVGLMIAGQRGQDRHILAVSRGIEDALQAARQ